VINPRQTQDPVGAHEHHRKANIPKKAALPCGTGFSREEASTPTASVSTAMPPSRLKPVPQVSVGQSITPHPWERIHSRRQWHKQLIRRGIHEGKQVGCQAASRAFDFDLGRPVKPRWPNAELEPWATRQDAGLAALGQGWPFAAAHGSRSAVGYTEPKRGAEWWGKSVLLTFALLKSEAP